MFKWPRGRTISGKKEKQKTIETQAEETARETGENRTHNTKQNPSNSVERLLNGEEVVVSFPDLNQIDLGPSCCGLAALNAARVILWQNAQMKRLRDNELLLELMEKRTLEDIADISSVWNSDEYLEVEELCQRPEFQETLRLQSTHFGKPRYKKFEDLLSKQLQKTETHSVLIITRAPETIACFRLVHVQYSDVFVTFDPYRRPDHPDGAGLIFDLFVESTAQRLAELLAVDPDLSRNEDGAWQNQAFTNYTAHFFVANTEAEKAVERPSLESNPDFLTLRREMDNSTTEISLLKREIERLKAWNAQSRTRELDQNNANDRESALEDENDYLRFTLNAVRQQLNEERDRSDRNLEALREENRRLRAKLVRDAESLRSLPESSSSTDQRYQASSSTIIHPAYQQRNLSPTYPTRALNSYQRNAASPVPSSSKHSDTYTDQMKSRSDRRKQPPVPFKLDDGAEELERTPQPQDDVRKVEMFECAICLDDHPIDFMATIERCEHRYCRQCIRDFIISELAERRYPIMCPVCSIEAENVNPVVTDELVQLVGLPEKHYETYVELQLGASSVLSQCRGCKRFAYVDRAVYEDAKIITCPLPDCSHSWCKACQQAVPEDGEGHSCAGALEFDRLLLEKGWKRCPGCQTPVHKNEGCNHITCVTPGCNSHSCYQCGALISQSTAVAKVRNEVSKHIAKCTSRE